MKKQRNTQIGTTLIEILFATMILSVGLISIMAFFPLGVEMHRQSIQDEKSSIDVESLKDAIVTACKYAVVDKTGKTQIAIVHDGMGILVNGVPEGKEIITLPDTAQPISRDDTVNPNGTTPSSGVDVKYEKNDPVRFPDQAGKRVYKLGQQLLQDTSSNKYYNRRDDLATYAFDIEVREAVTSRRPRSPGGVEDYTSTVRVFELASLEHDEYEFTVRVYHQWRPRSSTEIKAGRENGTLVRVYSFVASVIR
jgi:hypothetical protein